MAVSIRDYRDGHWICVDGTRWHGPYPTHDDAARALAEMPDAWFD